MSHILPEKDQISALMSLRGERPVRMLNLVRFRSGTDDKGRSGEELFDRYLQNVTPVIGSVGANVLFSGSVLTTIIGPADEKWDRMLIVEYPSLHKFIAMSQSAAYREVAEDRTAALADSRLIAVD